MLVKLCTFSTNKKWSGTFRKASLLLSWTIFQKHSTFLRWNSLHCNTQIVNFGQLYLFWYCHIYFDIVIFFDKLYLNWCCYLIKWVIVLKNIEFEYIEYLIIHVFLITNISHWNGSITCRVHHACDKIMVHRILKF